MNLLDYSLQDCEFPHISGWPLGRHLGLPTRNGDDAASPSHKALGRLPGHLEGEDPRHI
jgi:hypothetical protein